MPLPLCTMLKPATSSAMLTNELRQGANWEGTSDGAEGNMLDEILADLIDNERMKIKKVIIDIASHSDILRLVTCSSP